VNAWFLKLEAAAAFFSRKVRWQKQQVFEGNGALQRKVILTGRPVSVEITAARDDSTVLHFYSDRKKSVLFILFKDIEQFTNRFKNWTFQFGSTTFSITTLSIKTLNDGLFSTLWINDIQQNYTQYLVSLCWLSQLLKSYSECRYDECRYDECRYDECRYADCRGAFCSHRTVSATFSNTVKMHRLLSFQTRPARRLILIILIIIQLV
jgi:hypothetical protein